MKVRMYDGFSDVLSEVLMDADDKQNVITNIKLCDYSTLSNNANPCRNLGHYKCSHCSSSFCLEHDLQHQQDLKGEICDLLSQAKVGSGEEFYLKDSVSIGRIFTRISTD